MTTKELEKQIVKAIKEESKILLASEQPYKDLIKLVKNLFKQFKEKREYATSTIIGMTKELEK
jgi:hypothetical protein|tara:strand:+ start:472 stop:660 length:189 start_codon:yes stop_codon:yes gene_type:complete